MKTVAANSVSPELLAQLQSAVDDAAAGRRDREEMRAACERMDRLGEEVRKRQGVLDVGVPAIRELRDA